MATIAISIPDAALTRVVNAVAAQYGYPATVPDPADASQAIPNPQTKGQFAKAVLAGFLKDILRGAEADAAAAAARATALATADSVVIT